MTENNIADSIIKLAASVPEQIDEDPRKIVLAILSLTEEICVEGEYEEQFDQWCDEIADLWCKVNGEHLWTFDHCGFWGHQYCALCRSPKYPEIPGSCSKCVDLMKITESEYNQTLTED